MRYDPRDLAGRVNCFWNQDMAGSSCDGEGVGLERKNGIRLKGSVQAVWNRPGKNAINRMKNKTIVVAVEKL